jgi:hypothetical protein
MLNEELPVELVNRFIYEMFNYVGGSSDTSFVAELTSNLKCSIQESIKNEFSDYIQEHVIPSIRNIEIQTAIQVSKTNEFYAELKKITDHLSIQLSKANDIITLVKGSATSNMEKIENTIKQVNKKADLYELQVLSRELSNMTPLSTFYQFQEWSQSLASKSEIQRLDKKNQEVENALGKRPTFEDMQNEDSKIIVDVKSLISKEKTEIFRKLGKVKEGLPLLDEKIEVTKGKIQQSNEILTKRINEVLEFIQEKPWNPDVEEVVKVVKTKAAKVDLDLLRDSFEPKMQDILMRSIDIERDLKEYSDVMARFDEVILTKSSKEDVKVVQQMMKTFVTQINMDPILVTYSEKFENVETKLLNHAKAIEEVAKEIAAYSAVSAVLKTQSKDYLKMMDSIRSINELMRHKADKADIYNMFDVVGYRDDVIALSTSVEKLKDLFTQSVLLQHETLGTFIPSVDPQVTKNRHRAEIGKNLDLILRKLNPTPDKLEKSLKSRKKLSSVASIKLETTLDEKMLTQRTNSTKHRRVSSAAGHKRLL